MSARITEAMVEAAAAAYAKETGYYVEFHRGLRSESADKIHRGIRAALAAALSTEPGEAKEMVLVPKAALDWLNGEGPDDNGYWFGDGHEALNPVGAFWWRKVFNRMKAAPLPEESHHGR